MWGSVFPSRSTTSSVLVPALIVTSAIGYYGYRGRVMPVSNTPTVNTEATHTLKDFQPGVTIAAHAEPEAKTSCRIFPATAQVNAEADLFAHKIGILQNGYRANPSNPFAACGNSAAGKAAFKNFGFSGFVASACPNNHQEQLAELAHRKALYYERYLALSREPACAGLLSSAEKLALGGQSEGMDTEGRPILQRPVVASAPAPTPTPTPTPQYGSGRSPASTQSTK